DRIGEAVGKYFDRGFSGHVTIIKSNSRFTADCMIRLDSGVSLQTTGEALEPTLAFDAAAERLEKRLRRYNRRAKSRSYGTINGEILDVPYAVMEPLGDDDEEIPEEDRKSTRLNSSHVKNSYAVFGLKIKTHEEVSVYLVWKK